MSQAQQLASLIRLDYDMDYYSWYNNNNDSSSNHSLPPPFPNSLVMAMVHSIASSYDLHEILHEEILDVTFVNPLFPGSPLGAISYIHSIEEAGGDYQIVTIRTIGIKNMDVINELEKVDIPLSLLQRTVTSSPSIHDDDHDDDPANLSRSTEAVSATAAAGESIQELCKGKCPPLYNKIVVQLDRRILRQVPKHHEPFLL
jgi:hypothetical protein